MNLSGIQSEEGDQVYYTAYSGNLAALNLSLIHICFGFRCGFLGLLHMEIITERLEREFDLDIITTTPSVRYRLTLTDGTVEMIDNPSSYPDPSNIVKQEEPFVDVHPVSYTHLCRRSAPSAGHPGRRWEQECR